MTIDTSKLKLSTKSLVAGLVGFGTLMQIPAVSGYVLALTKAHPHMDGIVGALVGAAALLHNPQVQEALGIKQTVQVTTEAVSVPSAD